MKPVNSPRLSVLHTAPSQRWLLGAVFSSLCLSACQSVPSTTATLPDATTTTVQPTTAPAIAVSNTTSERYSTVDDHQFQPKPYIPTDEERRQQAAMRANQSNNAPYDTRYADPTMESEPSSEPIIIAEPVPEVIIIPIPQTPIVVPPPEPPSHQELLERARQHSAKPASQSTSNRDTLPAFRNLMAVGVDQLSRGELTAAESSFTRAQRLAPQSSAVYFYLAQVALKKNQPHKAEAIARRGLRVSEDTTRRRALWQLILRAGQMQNNARVVQEAEQALR